MPTSRRRAPISVLRGKWKFVMRMSVSWKGKPGWMRSSVTSWRSARGMGFQNLCGAALSNVRVAVVPTTTMRA